VCFHALLISFGFILFCVLYQGVVIAAIILPCSPPGSLTSSDRMQSIAMAARRWTPGGQQSYDPWHVPQAPNYYGQMKDCIPRLPGPLMIAIPCVGGFSAGRAALKILHQDDVRFVNIFDKDPDLECIMAFF